jgi:replicative DNA helicase
MTEPIRDPILERPLPSSPDTERAILGAIILSNDLIAQATELLTPSDFYVPSHRRIFVAMISLFERGSEINPILIAEELRRDNALESAGGILFLTNLTNGLPHVTSVVQFTKVVRGKSLLRQLVKVASKVTAEAIDEEDEPDAILDHAERAIGSLRDQRPGGASVVSIREVAEQARQHLATLNDGGDRAIASPWTRLNNACRGGPNPTELWGMLALQKHGKSSVAKQWVEFAARTGHRCLIFTREMSPLKIFYRMLSPFTDIPVSQIRAGLGQGQIDRTINAIKNLEDKGIFFDSRTSDMADVYLKVREMVRLEGIDWVVLDYANQFSAAVRKGANRAEEVAKIWRGSKDFSQDLDIATLVLGHPTEIPATATKKEGERQAPYFHQSAESKEAAKAVDVGVVLWTDLGKGSPESRPATFYIDYQRDEEAGGQIPVFFNGRIMEFHEPKDESNPTFVNWNE